MKTRISAWKVWIGHDLALSGLQDLSNLCCCCRRRPAYRISFVSTLQGQVEFLPPSAQTHSTQFIPEFQQIVIRIHQSVVYIAPMRMLMVVDRRVA